MPLMNGYEAAAAIRNLDDNVKAATPIIAMTANAFAEDVILAKNAGMKIVFVPAKNKPDVEEISDEIKKGLDIRYAETMEDILPVALTGKIAEKKPGKKKKKAEAE